MTNKEKKLWSVCFHSEVFVEAKTKEEALNHAWHDIITDTADRLEVDEPAEIDED